MAAGEAKADARGKQREDGEERKWGWCTKSARTRREGAVERRGEKVAAEAMVEATGGGRGGEGEGEGEGEGKAGRKGRGGAA